MNYQPRPLPNHRPLLRSAFLLTNLALVSLAFAATETTPPAPAVPEKDAVELDHTVITEVGVTRANNVLNLPDVTPTFTPGANPLVALNRIPGINVNSSTNFALRTTDGTGLRLRAFSLNVIGVAVDGIPSSSANGFQSSPPTRLIDAENVASIVVSPGTGDVSTPSASALGGSINFYTRSPERNTGAQFTVSAGSRELRRAFFRVDSGVFANNWTAFFSASDARQLVNFSDSDKPSLKRTKYDAQIQYQSAKFVLNAGISHIKVDDHDDRPISGSLYGNWTPTASPTGDLSDQGRKWFYATVDDGNPNGLQSVNYDKSRNGNVDTLYRLNAVFSPNENLTITAIPYYQDRNSYHYGPVPYNSARGFYESAIRAIPGRTDVVAPLGYPTALLAAPNTLPAGVTSLASVDAAGDNKPNAREATTPGHRQGIPISVEWRTGNQTIGFGAWFEEEESFSGRYLRNLVGGVITNPFDYSGIITTYFERNNTLNIQQYFLKDSIKLVDDRLTISGGIKALSVSYDFEGIPDNAYFDSKTRVRRTPVYSEYFLPQIGAVWKLNKTEELFVNLSQNYAAPDTAVIYGTTFDQSKLEAERADNLDFGVRTSRGNFSASLAGYVIKYKNRVGDVTGYNALGFGAPYTATAYTNVGAVDGYGLELAAAYRPTSNLTLNLATAWQSLEYQDNYSESTSATTSVVRVIKGNTVPNTPQFTINGDATYFFGSAFYAAVNIRYQGDIFLTTQNNQSLPGYTLVGAGIGYDGIRKKGPLKNVRIAVNVENVFDSYWFYTTGASTAYSNGSFSVGTPRAVYFTVATKF